MPALRATGAGCRNPRRTERAGGEQRARDGERRRRVRHRKGRGRTRGGGGRLEKDDTTGGCGSEGREKDEREDRSNSESPRQNVRPDRGGGGQRGGGREIKRFERREGRVEGEERNERDVASRQEIAEDRGIEEGDARRRCEEWMRGGAGRRERVNLEVAAERVFIIRTDEGTQRPGLPLMMLYSRLARSLVPTRTRLAFSRIRPCPSSSEGPPTPRGRKSARSLNGQLSFALSFSLP